MNFRLASILLLVGASFLTATPAGAQAVGASLQGFITDSSGAVLPSASIIVLNVATGASRELRSDGEGRYRVPILPPGEYEVHVKAAGFQALVRRGIQLAVGQSIVADLSLQVGALETEVSVTAEAHKVRLEAAGTSRRTP